MLTVAAGTTAAAAVADAATRSFATLGQTVVSMPLASLVAAEGGGGPSVPDDVLAVVVPDLRRVECVAGPGDLAVVAACAPALGAAEWQVVALVPAAAAGDAHRALRDTPALIQPWWLDDEGQPCFGGLEIA